MEDLLSHFCSDSFLMGLGDKLEEQEKLSKNQNLK